MVSKNLESIDCPCGSLGSMIGPHPTPFLPYQVECFSRYENYKFDITARLEPLSFKPFFPTNEPFAHRIDFSFLASLLPQKSASEYSEYLPLATNLVLRNITFCHNNSRLISKPRSD